MTPAEHNKTLGICHLAYGGLMTLLFFTMLIFMWMLMSAIPSRPGGPDPEAPVALIGIMGIFLFIYTLIFFLPSIIAGYALLKHKSWARTASIVAGVLETMNFPLGTAVAVYSFWFMFSDAGKSLYSTTPTGSYAQQPYALHDPPPQPASDWNARTYQERERSYAPPAQPPDWRDQ